jgi:alkylhydroperoxidase family enzyme
MGSAPEAGCHGTLHPSCAAELRDVLAEVRDPKADAAVRFAVKVVKHRGHVSDDDLHAVKRAGYDDAQVIEIVMHVALNTWTNYINEVARTEVDFPVVTPAAAA